jgi:hypothetical protein
MALIVKGTKCALCDAPLDGGGALVATSAFIGDRHDPLWRFSDAAMHRTCFLAWGLRETFIKRFNDAVGGVVFGNGTRHHMSDDGTIVSVKSATEL